MIFFDGPITEPTLVAVHSEHGRSRSAAGDLALLDDCLFRDGASMRPLERYLPATRSCAPSGATSPRIPTTTTTASSAYSQSAARGPIAEIESAGAGFYRKSLRNLAAIELNEEFRLQQKPRSRPLEASAACTQKISGTPLKTVFP
jgi:hypothetical protein